HAQQGGRQQSEHVTGMMNERQHAAEGHLEQEAPGGQQERGCQQPRLLHLRLRMRGSKRSRRPSPRKLKPITLSMIIRPGNTPSHHAWRMKERPSASMRPQLGSGGWVPRTKKLSAASARMANARLMDI